jgi:hypothetical protein
LKKRYKFLIVLTAWFVYFYYTGLVGWRTDRSYEPGIKPWIAKSFCIDEPMVLCCHHWYNGWYYELDLPHSKYLFHYTLDEFRRDPTKYEQSLFSSLHLLEPGTEFKIIQAFDCSTWGCTFLCIKAILKSGPYAGKRVIVHHLFDKDVDEKVIFAPKKDIPISEIQV